MLRPGVERDATLPWPSWGDNREVVKGSDVGGRRRFVLGHDFASCIVQIGLGISQTNDTIVTVFQENYHNVDLHE
jgi:hypothetical protein